MGLAGFYMWLVFLKNECLGGEFELLNSGFLFYKLLVLCNFWRVFVLFILLGHGNMLKCVIFVENYWGVFVSFWGVFGGLF